MEDQQSKSDGDEHHHRGQPPKDGRSRIHRIIRDRIVGSQWFSRIVMFVIILNSLLLWPWTDAAKQAGHLKPYHVYPMLNNLFVIVYLVEFILKVRKKSCIALLHELYCRVSCFTAKITTREKRPDY